MRIGGEWNYFENEIDNFGGQEKIFFNDSNLLVVFFIL